MFPPGPAGYSHVVEMTGPGRTIYIAGQLGYDASGKLPKTINVMVKGTGTHTPATGPYKARPASRPATVRHFLTHTSGLGDIFGPEFQQKKDSLHEIKDYLQLFAGKPLRFEPGTDFSYSNGGFIVLGLMTVVSSVVFMQLTRADGGAISRHDG